MHRQTVAIFAIVFCFCLLLSARLPVYGDAEQPWFSIKQKLLGHEPQSLEKARGPDQQRLFHRGVDGNYYSKYPLLQELNVVPFFLAGWLAHRWGWSEGITALWSGIWPALIAAIFFLSFAWVCERLGASRGLSYVLSGVLLFTTPLWIVARVAYGEMLQTLLMVWLIHSTLRVLQEPQERKLIWVGLVWGIAINSKILFFAWVPFLAALVWWVWRQTSKYTAWLYMLAGVVPGAFLFFGYNWLRYGNPLSPGYVGGHDGVYSFFLTPTTTGLHGLLFSSGKSIFLYAPCLLLSLWGMRQFWREQRSLCWLHLGPTAIWFVMVAHWWAWSGDVGWGPRLVVPLLPLLCLPLVVVFRDLSQTWLRKATMVTVLGLGLSIQILGLCFNPVVFTSVLRHTIQQSCKGIQLGVASNDLFFVHFVPEMSPVRGHWWLLKAQIWGDPVLLRPPWESLKLVGWHTHLKGMKVDIDFWFTGTMVEQLWAGLLGIIILLLAWYLWYLRRIGST